VDLKSYEGPSARLLSRPVPIIWAGFESDTYRLQQAGWSFSAEQDIRHQTMRLAMHHSKMRLTGITEVTNWEYINAPDHWHLQTRKLTMIAVGNVHVVDGKLYETLAQSVRFPVMKQFEPWKFHPIDCTPTYTTEEAKSLEDLVYFAPLDRKRIILPDEAVPELMARILELQEPVREEHFRQQARAASPVLRAQILSIAS
jgi:hypothetical protein